MRIFWSLLFGLVPATLFAGTSTVNFTVSATVNDTCTVSANNLSFGAYNPTLGTVANSTTSVLTTCTNLTTYDIGLDAGTGTNATVATRIMTSGSDTIEYSLFQDMTHSTVWGNTIGTNTVAKVGNGLQQTTTIYGQIFASQTAVPTGSYSDTILVTVTF